LIGLHAFRNPNYCNLYASALSHVKVKRNNKPPIFIGCAER
jgi:hypothetical protein